MKRSFQPLSASSQQPLRHQHLPAQPSQPVLLRTEEAAALLRFEGPKASHAFRTWANRWNVPRLHRGRVCLWDQRVLMDVLSGVPWTKRRQDVA